MLVLNLYDILLHFQEGKFIVVYNVTHIKWFCPGKGEDFRSTLI